MSIFLQLVVVFSVLMSLSVPAWAKSSSERILDAARDCVGKKMWLGYGLPNGTLGCAAALSNVLKKAGYTQAHSATVTVLRRQLLSTPGVHEVVLKQMNDPLDVVGMYRKAKSGDVLLAFMEPPTKLNGGPNAHCGIVGANGTIFTNDWNNGIWTNANYDQFFHWYKDVRVIQFTK